MSSIAVWVFVKLSPFVSQCQACGSHSTRSNHPNHRSDISFSRIHTFYKDQLLVMIKSPTLLVDLRLNKSSQRHHHHSQSNGLSRVRSAIFVNTPGVWKMSRWWGFWPESIQTKWSILAICAKLANFTKSPQNHKHICCSRHSSFTHPCLPSISPRPASSLPDTNSVSPHLTYHNVHNTKGWDWNHHPPRRCCSSVCQPLSSLRIFDPVFNPSTPHSAAGFPLYLLWCARRPKHRPTSWVRVTDAAFLDPQSVPNWQLLILTIRVQVRCALMAVFAESPFVYPFRLLFLEPAGLSDRSILARCPMPLSPLSIQHSITLIITPTIFTIHIPFQL